MKTTIELLDKALSKGFSQRALSKQMGLSPSNLAVARNHGSLSPVVAGQLAELLDDDVKGWMALAALESQPRSRVTDRLRRIVQKIGFEHIRKSIARLRPGRRLSGHVQPA